MFKTGPATGRPVVVVPYILKAPLKLDRVMVCWDASRNAARAVADAMPFLERAQSQTINGVTVSAAVLDHKESDRYFGVPLTRRGIQPVYLKIRNEGSNPYRLRLSSLGTPTSRAAYRDELAKIGK